MAPSSRLPAPITRKMGPQQPAPGANNQEDGPPAAGSRPPITRKMGPQQPAPGSPTNRK